MGKYFGTDGFRGEANKTLTFDHAIKIGRYLGWYYGKRLDRKAKVVIGKDTRRSSYMFEYALCTGLMASGADAYIMHVTTTPSVSYIARVDDFDCGIMISASHNPYYDNGIKIVNNNGEKMDEETLLKIEDYLDGEIENAVAEFKEKKAEAAGCNQTELDAERKKLRPRKYDEAYDQLTGLGFEVERMDVSQSGWYSDEEVIEMSLTENQEYDAVTLVTLKVYTKQVTEEFSTRSYTYSYSTTARQQESTTAYTTTEPVTQAPSVSVPAENE